jgi:hypothetical protein
MTYLVAEALKAISPTLSLKRAAVTGLGDTLAKYAHRSAPSTR